MSFTYKYPRPALTVDAVIFGVAPEGLKIILIQRKADPFLGSWALPGGFVDVDGDDTTEAAVARELVEETSLKGIYLEQLHTFSKKGRDPRERVVTVAYLGLVRPDAVKPVAGDDAAAVQWFPVESLPQLAFDHQDIVDRGLSRIRSKARRQPIGFELLPKKFTLLQIQSLYETLLQKSLDKRNFQKKLTSLGVLQKLQEKVPGPGRPSHLYQFNTDEYHRLTEAGFNFEL